MRHFEKKMLISICMEKLTEQQKQNINGGMGPMML
jgi:hypothetical protein